MNLSPLPAGLLCPAANLVLLWPCPESRIVPCKQDEVADVYQAAGQDEDTRAACYGQGARLRPQQMGWDSRAVCVLCLHSLLLMSGRDELGSSTHNSDIILSFPEKC